MERGPPSPRVQTKVAIPQTDIPLTASCPLNMRSEECLSEESELSAVRMLSRSSAVAHPFVFSVLEHADSAVRAPASFALPPGVRSVSLRPLPDDILQLMKAHASSRLLLVLACCLGPVAQAQIPVGPGPSPAIEFTTTPPATEWATHDVAFGNGGTFGTPAQLDAFAQTLNATGIVTALPTTSATATSRLARHQTTLGVLVTQPAGVPAVVLLARLQNTSGSDIHVLSVSYDFSVVIPPVTDLIPGQRAYWSLTGLPGSWTLIPEFSGLTVNTAVSTMLEVGTWPHGANLHVLWLDDNNETGADGAFAIDNVIFSGGIVDGVIITDQPDSLTVPERGPATFTVTATGLPLAYHWLRNGVPIPGAHSASYTNPSAVYPGDHGAVFSVIVSNFMGIQTSADAVLTVNPDTNAPVALRAVGDFSRTSATISFSEPIEPATLDASSFQIFPTGTDPQSTSVPATTAVVTNATNVVIGFAAEYATDVNHSLIVFDVHDTAHTPNAIANTVLPLQQVLQLIDFNGPNNVWRFSLETNLFGTGWETPGYDDTTWSSGPTGIGRGISVIGAPHRTLAYPSDDSSPVFLRRNFYLPASAAGVTLFLRHVIDDGAVFYLNGQEVRRFNAPAGPLSVASRAPSAAGPVISSSATLPATNLVAGENWIAAVVLQNGAASSDMLFALELVAIVTNYPSGPPVILAPPASQTVAENASATFSVQADGALPLAFQWHQNGTAIPGATNAFLQIASALPGLAGSYHVSVTNQFGATNSASATLTVQADLVPPAFLSAVGEVNLTNILLTIVDAFGLNLAAAETPANYTVSGPDTLAILSAVLINQTNVLLTTSPRTPLQNYTVTLTNIVDRSVAALPAWPSARPLQSTVVLFDFNHVWRYDQNGMDLGTSWKEPGYNDSAWPAGAGILAAETSLAPLTLFTNLAGGSGTNTVLSTEAIPLAGLGGRIITYYFRTTLNGLPFDPAATGNVLRATSYIDDGAAIYVNGLEAMRFNLTNPANYTNYATVSSIEGAGGLITSNLLGFVAGNNVIAAEVHQNTAFSSDVAWGMRLEALVSEFIHGDPVLKITASGGTVIIRWTDGGTLQRSTDLSSPLNWENVPGSPASPFTTNTTGSGTFYRVVVP